MSLICLGKCQLNTKHLSIDTLKDPKKETTVNFLPISNNGIPYRVEYCPVGNHPSDPIVIICGKTPGKDTFNKFLSILRNGNGNVESAAFQSIYSNMKDNLFKYLDKILLFDFLAMNGIDYWNNSDRKKSWDDIFINYKNSKRCGVQLTQACDCAILAGNNSREPKKSAFDYISKVNEVCLFNSFVITEKLRLIIFLDTPGNDNRFHQEEYLATSNNGNVKTISITHPSGQNNDIYSKLDKLDEGSTRTANAKMLLEKAQSTIACLMKSS